MYKKYEAKESFSGDFQAQPGSQVLFLVAGSGETRWKNLVGEGKMDNKLKM